MFDNRHSDPEYWEERIATYQRNIKESAEWMDEYWPELPKAVKFMLMRAETCCEDKIADYQKIIERLTERGR